MFSTHKTQGSLTGLVPGMFLNNQGERVPCPDPAAGLYVQSRAGITKHITIPPDAMAFQIGETSQIHSGGVLQATPHAVRGCRAGDVTREALAVFMEPECDGDMDLPPSKTLRDVQDASIALPTGVRTLSQRWKPGMNFGDFSIATFAAFYD